MPERITEQVHSTVGSIQVKLVAWIWGFGGLGIWVGNGLNCRRLFPFDRYLNSSGFIWIHLDS